MNSRVIKAHSLGRVVKTHSLDEIIADAQFLVSMLKDYRSIVESGNCNVCAWKKRCDFVPEPGQLVRYNCPFYEGVDD